MKRSTAVLMVILMSIIIACFLINKSKAYDETKQGGIVSSFDIKNPFLQKTYSVVVSTLHGKEKEIVSLGSGFALQSGSKIYFITAYHVFSKYINGNMPTIDFYDYRGTMYTMQLIAKDTDADIALFTIPQKDARRILPETIITATGIADIDEAVYACGFVYALGAKGPLLPACLPRTARGKVEKQVARDGGPNETLHYVIIEGGLEYGFSGGPMLNKDKALVGVNVMVTRAGQFGIFISSKNINALIVSYMSTLKEDGRTIPTP
jgi:S1-C subfamily serine protease